MNHNLHKYTKFIILKSFLMLCAYVCILMLSVSVCFDDGVCVLYLRDKLGLKFS